jgi:type IV pilus assembly protein PilV
MNMVETFRHTARSRNARGFTLVEVMVALIIIAIGMLGIAKMQGLALSSTGSSRSRALAAIEASSLAAAMQANRTYWSSPGSLPGTISVATSGGSVSTLTSDSATMATALSTVTGSPCGASMGANLSCYCTTGNGAPCTAYINLAASDLYDWAWSLASFLPNSTANVKCSQATSPSLLPVDCTIYISWSENTVALNSQEASNTAVNGSTVQVTYSLYVVP